MRWTGRYQIPCNDETIISIFQEAVQFECWLLFKGFNSQMFIKPGKVIHQVVSDISQFISICTFKSLVISNTQGHTRDANVVTFVGSYSYRGSINLDISSLYLQSWRLSLSKAKPAFRERLSKDKV